MEESKNLSISKSRVTEISSLFVLLVAKSRNNDFLSLIHHSCEGNNMATKFTIPRPIRLLTKFGGDALRSSYVEGK